MGDSDLEEGGGYVLLIEKKDTKNINKIINL